MSGSTTDPPRPRSRRRRKWLLGLAALVGTIAIAYERLEVIFTDPPLPPLPGIVLADYVPPGGPRTIRTGLQPHVAAGVSPRSPAAMVVEGVLLNHQNEDNPRNRSQRAYVAGGPGQISPGQVGLLATGYTEVTFHQYPNPHLPVRSFAVNVE